MKRRTISMTEATRNFAECINQVHNQNVTFVLVKNGVPVARLTPVGEKVCTGRQLAKALNRVPLSADDARAWLHDLRSARKRHKTPLNKWSILP
jgi:prevent-host-death family protein